MDHILQLNEFFVEGGDQGRSHVLLHITEPSTPEEKKRGYFFAIVEINNGSPSYIAQMQSYIDEIENGYYSADDDGNKDPLEVIIEATNQKIPPAQTTTGTLHCVVGAIRAPEIVFTYAGAPQMLLLYKNRQGSYQTMNLVQTPETTEDEGKQLFSQLVQGKISLGDYLVVGTPEVSHYFSLDRLNKIVSSRPARQSAEHIQHVLQGLRNGLSFGGLIVHLAPTQPEPVTINKKRPAASVADAGRSLHSIFNLEKNTADTLSPSLFPKLNTKLKTMLESAEDETIETPAPVKPAYPAAEINAAHLHAPKASPRANNPANTFNAAQFAKSVLRILIIIFGFFRRTIVWLFLLLLGIIQFVFRNIGMLFLVITNYQKRRQNILEDWKRQWRSQKENLKHLPWTTKLIIIGATLGIIVFSISILYLRYYQKKTVANAAAQSALELVQGKKDAAESALIYRNEAAALADLQDATTALGQVPCTDKLYADKCTTLKNGLNDLYAKVRKVVMAHPTLLTTWAEPTLKNLTRATNLLIASSPVSSTVFSYDISTHETKFVNVTPGAAGYFASAAPKENDYVLFGYNHNNIVQLAIDGGTSKSVDISYPADNVEISALNIYSRRLYTLDSAHNQVYKHDTIKAGFDRGKEWFKNADTNMKDAVSLTIDGDLYVLHSSGSVDKFTKGEKQPFEIQNLDPVLTSGNKIWTYTDALYIYILDGRGKRLIVLDKDGKLQKQITAAEFIAPSDMSIDETAATAYILDSGKLYQISLK